MYISVFSNKKKKKKMFSLLHDKIYDEPARKVFLTRALQSLDSMPITNITLSSTQMTDDHKRL